MRLNMEAYEQYAKVLDINKLGENFISIHAHLDIKFNDGATHRYRSIVITRKRLPAYNKLKLTLFSLRRTPQTRENITASCTYSTREDEIYAVILKVLLFFRRRAGARTPKPRRSQSLAVPGIHNSPLESPPAHPHTPSPTRG